MTSVPTVSVCMPVSRDATVVRRALDSVVAQDLSDFEVLIGDETGSAAGPVAELADPRLHYQRNPHRLGFTKNHGASARPRPQADTSPSCTTTTGGNRPTCPRWWPCSTPIPTLGMACCATVVDFGPGETLRWPVPLNAGRHDNVIGVLLREEWFLLPISTMWRGQLWAGPARQWPALCCADLQLFLSIADAGWGLYYLAEPLAHWVQHSGQSGAWRGSDHGLGVADDVLAFWGSWLEGRPDAEVALAGRQRARSASPAGPGAHPGGAGLRGAGVGRSGRRLRPGIGPRSPRAARSPPAVAGVPPARPSPSGPEWA